LEKGGFTDVHSPANICNKYSVCRRERGGGRGALELVYVRSAAHVTDVHHAFALWQRGDGDGAARVDRRGGRQATRKWTRVMKDEICKMPGPMQG
jgi:hypothetical protein